MPAPWRWSIPPYDEDFGYVTLEAFLARKPVITCVDSGGPNEFVVDGINGLVCEPSAEALADAMNQLANDRRRAATGRCWIHRRRSHHVGWCHRKIGRVSG